MDDQVRLKDRFVELIEQEKKTLHFFSNIGSDTEQTIAEAQRRIAMYEALIKSTDEP